jgi:hypothetical protein
VFLVFSLRSFGERARLAKVGFSCAIKVLPCRFPLSRSPIVRFRIRLLDDLEAVVKLEQRPGGAPKHCSSTVHYCFALCYREILVFEGAFAPPTVNLASPVLGSKLGRQRLRCEHWPRSWPQVFLVLATLALPATVHSDQRLRVFPVPVKVLSERSQS